MNALVVGNGSYILWLNGHDLHGPTMINCCITVILFALMKHILMKQMFYLLRCSDLIIPILSTDVIVVRTVEVF